MRARDVGARPAMVSLMRFELVPKESGCIKEEKQARKETS